MSQPLVLSLFPGIGLFDLAFEQEGFCVVRGPDLLWGGDVRSFHPPAGRFDGVIGGPPCQTHSGMKHLSLAGNGVEGGYKHGDMIPEFERVVLEAQPEWFVMENVLGAPIAKATYYSVDVVQLDNRALGESQSRKRRFCFGSRYGFRISPLIAAELLGIAEHPEHELCVLAGHGPALGQRVRGIAGRDWPEMARLQGLPDSWIECMDEERTLTIQGMKKVIGNGVPLPMGRAIARAVKQALYATEAA